MTRETLAVALDLLGKRTEWAGIWPTFLLHGGHKVKGAFELVQDSQRPHVTTVVVSHESDLTVLDPADIVGVTVNTSD